MFSRVALAAGLIFFAGAVAFFTYLNSRGVSPEELARRCAASRPEWQSYPEDVKGQIGAGPAAAWHGKPVRAEATLSGCRITFAIEGDWAHYECALPLLLRLPTGEVYTSADAEGGAERTYRFSFDHTLAALPPWVEVHYPHMEERLALDPRGYWAAPVVTP